MLLKYKKRKNINKQIAGKWTCKCMQGIFDYSKIYLFIYFQDYYHLFSPRCGYCQGPILDKATAFNTLPIWLPSPNIRF